MGPADNAVQHHRSAEEGFPSSDQLIEVCETLDTSSHSRDFANVHEQEDQGDNWQEGEGHHDGDDQEGDEEDEDEQRDKKNETLEAAGGVKQGGKFRGGFASEPTHEDEQQQHEQSSSSVKSGSVQQEAEPHLVETAQPTQVEPNLQMEDRDKSMNPVEVQNQAEEEGPGVSEARVDEDAVLGNRPDPGNTDAICVGQDQQLVCEDWVQQGTTVQPYYSNIVTGESRQNKPVGNKGCMLFELALSLTN